MTDNMKSKYIITLLWLMPFILLSAFTYYQYLHIQDLKNVQKSRLNPFTPDKLSEELKKIPQSEREKYEANKKDLAILMPSKAHNNSSEDVLKWFSQVAPEILTFNSENFLMRSDDFSIFFTEHGYNQYITIMDRSGVPVAMKKAREQKSTEKYFWKASVVSAPTLVTHADEIFNAETVSTRQWSVQVPLEIKAPEGKFGHVQSFYLRVVVLIKETLSKRLQIDSYDVWEIDSYDAWGVPQD